MSADQPATFNGGPEVSRTRGPVGDSILQPPSGSQPAFRQVRHGDGDPATTRRFTVKQNSSIFSLI